MNKQQSSKSIESSRTLSKIIKITIWAILVCAAVFYQFSKPHDEDISQNADAKINYALLGDIGGTNIRYQLVSFHAQNKLPLELIKQQRMKVKNFETFEASITYFLEDIHGNQLPQVAVIAVAGPIDQNTVFLTNVPKWGLLNGTQMKVKFNVTEFFLINDFEAASYGLMLVDNSEFVELNDKPINPAKLRGVIGPGTGLGHSVIFNAGQPSNNILVLPSEAGHSDIPFIDEESIEYINFLKQKLNAIYIDAEKAFCGPSIPYMYEFYFRKINESAVFEQMSSEDIVLEIVKENPTLVFKKVFSLFVKFYSAAVANFMIQHMTIGGVYLVGGLTKTLLPKIKQIDFLKQWNQRHAQMRKIIESIPIVFCNEVDLGLKGAFYKAKQFTHQVKPFFSKDKLNQDVF